MKALLTFVTAILFISCQKTNYLYHQKPKVPGQYLQYEHKIKEMKGNDKVDILWVIDNSASMQSHQMAVKQNVDFFLDTFLKTNLDWRMGLLSTDYENPPYVGLAIGDELSYKDTDAASRFKKAVSRLGINGSPTEMTFIPVKKHLTAHPHFLRKDSILALLIVTDAPEQSHVLSYTSGYYGRPRPGMPMPPGSGSTPKAMELSDFLDFLKIMKGNLKNVVTYGAFAATDLGCRINDQFPKYKGSSYEELVNKTNGKYFPLCSKDFGTELAKFGLDLVKRVQAPKIYLKKRPVLTTLRITYKGQEIPGGPQDQGGLWVYDFDSNAVIFSSLDFAAGENEMVQVEYREN
jgi:hypothetical protein